MLNGPHDRSPTLRTTVRNVVLILVGAAGLVLKGHYSGPLRDAVHSYGGNIAVSFAVYYWSNFTVTLLPLSPRVRKVLTAGLALAVVELFEALNGFGVMMNTYDPFDYAANAAGIALALAVDALTNEVSRPPSDPGEQTASGMRGRPTV